MRSRDYTRELHLKPTDQRLPMPVTVVVWLVVAVVGVWLVREVAATGAPHGGGTKATAVATTH